jgi:hypothetical protein
VSQRDGASLVFTEKSPQKTDDNTLEYSLDALLAVRENTLLPLYPHPAGLPDPFDSKYSAQFSNSPANSVE